MSTAVPEFEAAQAGGKRILLRSSLNVPVKEGVVANAHRVRASIKTIRAFAEHGGRIVVCGHIGARPTDSLRPVYDFLKKELDHRVFFSSSVAGSEALEKAHALKEGEVLLLENTRREAGEETNSPEFSKKLAALGDLYVNDAFSDSHRSHASIVGVPQFLPHFASRNFTAEISGILPARHPEKPSLAVIGGAKFLTKEPLLRHLVSVYDHVFVGGAIAHDFFLARGVSVGKSLVSGSSVPKDIAGSKNIILPEDVVVENANGVEEKNVHDIGAHDRVYDIGPKTFIRLSPLAQEARFILWNGPMGNFERGFTKGTDRMVELVAASRGASVVGGGDTIAAIDRLNVGGDFTFLSTAGGAMLRFIVEGTLPGIAALQS